MSMPDEDRGRRLRLCLIGSGSISQRVTELVAERLAHSVELVAIGVRPATTAKPWWPAHVQLVVDPNELRKIRPDVVMEAASRDAVAEWGEAALRSSRRFVVCSTSAFTEDALMTSLLDVAQTAGAQLVLAAGALGGLQALAAASLLSLDSVAHTVSKPLAAWVGTRAAALMEPSSMPVAQTLFQGTAREAAAAYPMNANAVVLTALAGIGLDRTRVELVADPSLRRNKHEILAKGAFGEFTLRIENEVMPSNPKTSEMTALSLVRLLETHVNPLVV